MTPERFIITIRALPGYDRPPIVRLRSFLKILQRAFGFQCVRLDPAPPDSTSTEEKERSQRTTN